MIKPPLLQRMVVISLGTLISINTLIFGFVLFLPQFFLRQGLTITNSRSPTTLVLSAARWSGCSARRLALSDAIGRTLEHHRRLDYHHHQRATSMRIRRAASDPTIVLSVGFVLIIAIAMSRPRRILSTASITPELFPTEIRLRANELIQHLWPRRCHGSSPFIVGALIASSGLPGVNYWLMIGLVVVEILGGVGTGASSRVLSWRTSRP